MVKKISALFLALVLCLTAMVVPVSALELGDAQIAFELKWDEEYYKAGDTAVLSVYMDAADELSLYTGSFIIGVNSAVFPTDINSQDDLRAGSTTSELFNSYYKAGDSNISVLAASVVPKVQAANTAEENALYDWYIKFTAAKNTGGSHPSVGTTKEGFYGSDFDPEEPILTISLVVGEDVADGTAVNAAITSGSVTMAKPIQTTWKYYKTPGTGTTTADIEAADIDVTAAVATATFGDAPCEHKPADAGVVTAPTCTTAGYTTYKCSECGETYTEEIAALGHTEETIPAVDAKCTTPGSTAGVKCSVCDAVITAPTTVEAVGHNYESVVTAPTCTEAGYTTYTCANCDGTYTADPVDALGHTAGAPVVENSTAATCGQAGSYESVVYCTVCNAEISRETVTVDEVPHSYEGVVTTPATCTEAGVKTFTCSACGDSYPEEISALGHTEETIPAVDATCTEAGKTAGVKCSVCDTVITAQETVDALGHDMQETAAAVDATCTEAGKTAVYTCANGCGTTEGGAEVDALGHDMVAGETVAPTCTKDGYTPYTCANGCGTTENKDVVAAEGHKFDKEVTVKEATCTAGGRKKTVCSVCDATKPGSMTDTEALGHNYVEDYFGAPTCTAPGKLRNKCTVCGDKVEETIPAKEHKDENGNLTTVVIPEKPATCTATGTTEGVKCTQCNVFLSGNEVIKKTDHKKVDGVVTEPTYNSQGYTSYVCPDCNEPFKSDFVPALTSSFVFNKVKAPSIKELRARDTIVLHLDVEGELSDDVTVVWEADNNKFKVVEQYEDGSIKVEAKRNGATKFTARIYDADGNEITPTAEGGNTVELVANAKFFQRIAGFFRVIFKKTINHAE